MYLSLCLFSLASSPLIFAEDTTQAEQTEIETESSTTDTVPLREKISSKVSHLQTQLKVDASAAQAEEVKDPFQSWNRKVYQFNDAIDQAVVR
ncbi:VacJ family lipoprotein, partial [Acinetobacter johnsonii]